MLKEYEVIIRETLEKKIVVEAASRDEAEAITERNWRSGDYILDADSFVGVDFFAKKRAERSHEGR